MTEQYLKGLLSLTEKDWCELTFRKEALRNRLTAEERIRFYRNARQTGIELAGQLREQYGAGEIEDYARRLGVTVTYEQTPKDGEYAAFACFREPDQILIFGENAQATDRMLREDGVWELLGGVPTERLLLAHELYHVLEQKLPAVYTTQKHVTVFKLGRLERRCRLCCLEEAGAMAFAGELTGLACDPNLYSVLMLLPLSRHEAQRHYQFLMEGSNSQ